MMICFLVVPERPIEVLQVTMKCNFAYLNYTSIMWSMHHPWNEWSLRACNMFMCCMTILSWGQAVCIIQQHNYSIQFLHIYLIITRPAIRTNPQRKYSLHTNCLLAIQSLHVFLLLPEFLDRHVLLRVLLHNLQHRRHNHQKHVH